MQIVQKVNWDDDYELSGTTGQKRRQGRSPAFIGWALKCYIPLGARDLLSVHSSVPVALLV
jgi:hypothetical protein